MAQSPSEDRQIDPLDPAQDPYIFLAAALQEKRTEHWRESQRKRQRREEGQRRGIGQGRKELPFHSFQREEGEKHNHDDSEIGRAHVLNSSHRCISYAVFCLKKKRTKK